MEHDDLQDVLSTDIDNSSAEELVDGNTDEEEKPKGEDIYVENDISKLERMLGISSTEETEPSVEEVNDSADISSDLIEDEEVVVEEPEEVHKEVERIKPVLLSDFMDPSGTESFTFLERNNGDYSIVSIDLKDKKIIQKAVRSPHYIFRYPKFTLRDMVLGFVEDKKDNTIHYTVYFPEYSLSFIVSSDYQKPYSQSFKDYFEDMVTRVRPSNMVINHYTNSITITSLKVLETGLLELETTMGTEKYIINNNDISFYAVLDYIRTISDQGVDKIRLSLIPEFFVRI